MPDFGSPVAQNVKGPSLDTLSDLMSLKQKQQQVQASDMQNQQSGIDLQETQKAQGLMRNIKNYQDGEGNVDFTKLIPDMMQAAPKNGSKYLTQVAQMQQAHTEASNSVNTLDANSRSQVGQLLYSLKGQKSDVISGAIDNLNKSYPTLSPAIKYFSGQIGPSLKSGDQTQIDGALDQAGRMVNPVSEQAPKTSFVSTQGGVQPFNTNALSPTGAGQQGTPMTPPNQTVPTTGGGVAIGNTTTGQIGPFAGQGKPGQTAPPQVDFPAGENGNTQAELQLQRTQAQQAANSAPTMHNINRSIINLVDGGDVSSGKWGEAMQKLRSATGFISDKAGDPNATDTNLAGKMLERSALTAAQGMGPHTNAGLEAQVRANGSLEYTQPALRKIAALNDALTTGATLYQGGVEHAISSAGGSVFTKRQFDQQWANTMNPSGGVDGVQALRYKNAIDNADATEKAAILKEVGGPGSKGAQALLGKLRSLHQLAGQQ